MSNLVWARELLERRVAGVEELSAARDLWGWHYRFESDAQLREASVKLESLYAANDLAAEFEPLLSHDDWKQRSARVPEKGLELADARTPDEIVAFVARAVSFLGSEKGLYQLRGVAWALGERAVAHDVVQTFVKRSLGHAAVSARTGFGAVAAAGWAASVRKGDHPEQAHVLVGELMASCGSDEQRANLLLEIYGHIPTPPGVGEFSADEHALLRSHQRLFAETGHSTAFLATIALTLDHDWATLRPLLEDILQSLPVEALPLALQRLVDALYWGVRDPNATHIPPQLGEWVLNQLLRIPDFKDLDGIPAWHLEEILKRVGRPDVSWLAGALAARGAEEKHNDGTRAVSYQTLLSKCVRRITTADCGDSIVAKAINDLLTFVGDNGSIGNYLPEVLRDVDPEGLVVPAAIVARLVSAADARQIRQLARIGGVYAVNASAWRTIAKAAIVTSNHLEMEARRSIFGALGTRFREWSWKPGEVPAIFPLAVQNAKAALDSEADVDLRLFWEWHLQMAEADLREQKERAKEERGE